VRTGPIRGNALTPAGPAPRIGREIQHESALVHRDNFQAPEPGIGVTAALLASTVVVFGWLNPKPFGRTEKLLGSLGGILIVMFLVLIVAWLDRSR
jgi:hypothetical protein